MDKDVFEMESDRAYHFVISNDGEITVSGGHRSKVVFLEDCPKVSLGGHTYAITGPLEEVTFGTRDDSPCYHHWKVLSVELDLPPEEDGRLICKKLVCERAGCDLWRVIYETVTCYTDEEDTEEFGSHPVYNPKTLEIERSTAECDFL